MDSTEGGSSFCLPTLSDTGKYSPIYVGKFCNGDLGASGRNYDVLLSLSGGKGRVGYTPQMMPHALFREYHIVCLVWVRGLVLMVRESIGESRSRR